MHEPFPIIPGVDPKDSAFLFPREPTATEPKRERAFFMGEDGASVPPKYPEKAPAPSPYDIVVDFFVESDGKDELSLLARVSREWCRAVRKHRFRDLHLRPGMDFGLLLQVFQPATVIPHIRHLHVNGELRNKANFLSDNNADHRWLHPLIPLFEHIARSSPIEYLFLQSLSWGDVPLAIRTALLPGLSGSVRALGIHDVDFWNSNQFLRTLNAFPRLQFLQIWHADFHAYNHIPAQIYRTEPLLLTEVVLGCAYTPLILEWMLGKREVLAIEELSVASRDMYRDDARLAAVVRKASPWLKVLHYEEWGVGIACEGAVLYDDNAIKAKHGRDSWVPSSPVRIFDTHSDDEEVVQDMDVDEELDDDMDEDPDEITGEEEPKLQSFLAEKNSDCRTTDIAQLVMKPTNIVEVKKSLLLPDDEGRHHLEDDADALSNPPYGNAKDLGFQAFADALSESIELPMLEQVEGCIYWRSAFSILTLKMLCMPAFTSDDFYRFDMQVNFESTELYEGAPWRQIDRLLAKAALPDEPEPEMDEDGEEYEVESDLLLRLEVCVKGWDLKGNQRKAKLRDLKWKLPRTVGEGKLSLSVGTWRRSGPRAGPPDWLDTYY